MNKWSTFTGSVFGVGMAGMGMSVLSGLARMGTRKMNNIGISAPPSIYPGPGQSTGQRLQVQPSPVQGLRFSFKK